MGLIIEDKIETAFKSLLEANSYIIANSISVLRFRDNTSEKSLPCVVVDVRPVQNEFGNTIGPLWMSDVYLKCVTYDSDDKDMNILNAIYQEVLEEVTNVTISELTMYGSIQFNAIELEPNEQDIEEEYQYKNVNLIAHVQT